MSDKIRVGVAGLGMGLGHVENYKKVAGAEVVAICDRDEAWIKHVQEKHGPFRTYLTYDEMLADKNIDAISMCLPTSLHAAGTIAALKAGKHVLCEKPMATTAQDAQAMADAAKTAGKTLMISYNRRFTPDAQYLKQIVQSGQLGRVYFVRSAWRRAMGCLPSANSQRATGTLNRNWFNERAKGGGVLFDLGSHMLDLACWLLNFPKLDKVMGANYSMFLPALAAASGQTGDAEDLATGMLKFTDGSAIQLEMSFGTFIDHETVLTELYGTEGGASLRDGVLKVFSGDGKAYSTTTVGRFNMQVETPQANFTNAVLTGKPPLVTAEQGVAVTTVLAAIRDAGLVSGDPNGKVYS